MRSHLFPSVLFLCCATLAAQDQASSTAPKVHASALGFTYSLPSDWDVVDAQPALPVVKQQAEQNATSEDEKKGVACVQVDLTARRGDPASVVVIVTLPFDCFGQTMTDKDLPGFAVGAAEGLKQSFDISDPVYGSYTLGSHYLWIERAQGIPKNSPSSHYTVEIACGLLKKGAVCWMAMAADDTSLQAFEHGTVSLDGEPATALVPADAFAKKPS